LILKRKSDVEMTTIDDEVVLIDPEKGYYYGLEGSSKYLWEALNNSQKSTEEIIQEWTPSFTNSATELHRLLEDAVIALREHGLILVLSDEK